LFSIDFGRGRIAGHFAREKKEMEFGQGSER